MTRNNKLLLIAAVVAAATITYFKLRETAVERRADEKLAHMIQISVDAAGSKNQQAVRLCETDINTILAQQFPEISRQGQIAAADIATYNSCCKLIYSLARDKIKGSSTTAQYVDERVQAHLGTPLRKLSSDLEAAISRFELSLKENTVGLARDLAQMNPQNAARTISLPVDVKSNTDVNQALKNLGLGGVTVGVMIPLDVWAVMSTKLVKSLVTKVATLAARMFARPAAAAAAEVTIAAADGPLPIGDIIAVIGGILTTYDVYSTQKQFEREMKQSMENMMPEVRRDLQKQILDHVHAILKDHQRLQDEIRQRSVQEYVK
jgi:hypothetical protein